MSCQQDNTGCTGKINATFEGKFKILNSCDVAEKNPLPMQMTTFHIHTVSSLPPLGVIAATAALSLSLSLLHLCPPIPRVGSVAAPEFPKQAQARPGLRRLILIAQRVRSLETCFMQSSDHDQNFSYQRHSHQLFVVGFDTRVMTNFS